MRKHNSSPWLAATLIALALALAGCGGSTPAPTSTSPGIVSGPFKLLVFSRTAGFRHQSIEVGVETVRQLGAANGFSVDHTEDPTQFTTDKLAPYAAVLFLSTTGDVLDAAQQQALEDYIRAGGGYAGVHSAADTEHDWPYYGELVGAYFLSHPVLPPAITSGTLSLGIQSGELIREAAEHPATAHLPERWTLGDEFYSFTSNPRGKVRVLLSIDESSYRQDPNTTNDPRGPLFPFGRTGVMNDHPMSWCHDRLGGRSWYTALGHEADLYSDPAYRQHLLAGILTAARRVAADCRPREAGPLAEPNTGPSIL